MYYIVHVYVTITAASTMYVRIIHVVCLCTYIYPVAKNFNHMVSPGKYQISEATAVIWCEKDNKYCIRYLYLQK